MPNLKTYLSFDVKRVESSNIHKISFNSNKNQMGVQFKSGAVYVYYKVPQQIFLNLIHADSVGSLFSKTIRDNYEFDRVI